MSRSKKQIKADYEKAFNKMLDELKKKEVDIINLHGFYTWNVKTNDSIILNQLLASLKLGNNSKNKLDQILHALINGADPEELKEAKGIPKEITQNFDEVIEASKLIVETRDSSQKALRDILSELKPVSFSDDELTAMINAGALDKPNSKNLTAQIADKKDPDNKLAKDYLNTAWNYEVNISYRESSYSRIYGNLLINPKLTDEEKKDIVEKTKTEAGRKELDKLILDELTSIDFKKYLDMKPEELIQNYQEYKYACLIAFDVKTFEDGIFDDYLSPDEVRLLKEYSNGIYIPLIAKETEIALDIDDRSQVINWRALDEDQLGAIYGEKQLSYITAIGTHQQKVNEKPFEEIVQKRDAVLKALEAKQVPNSKANYQQKLQVKLNAIKKMSVFSGDFAKEAGIIIGEASKIIFDDVYRKCSLSDEDKFKVERIFNFVRAGRPLNEIKNLAFIQGSDAILSNIEYIYDAAKLYSETIDDTKKALSDAFKQVKTKDYSQATYDNLFKLDVPKKETSDMAAFNKYQEESRATLVDSLLNEKFLPDTADRVFTILLKNPKLSDEQRLEMAEKSFTPKGRDELMLQYVNEVLNTDYQKMANMSKEECLANYEEYRYRSLLVFDTSVVDRGFLNHILTKDQKAQFLSFCKKIQTTTAALQLETMLEGDDIASQIDIKQLGEDKSIKCMGASRETMQFFASCLNYSKAKSQCGDITEGLKELESFKAQTVSNGTFKVSDVMLNGNLLYSQIKKEEKNSSFLVLDENLEIISFKEKGGIEELGKLVSSGKKFYITYKDSPEIKALTADKENDNQIKLTTQPLKKDAREKAILAKFDHAITANNADKSISNAERKATEKALENQYKLSAILNGKEMNKANFNKDLNDCLADLVISLVLKEMIHKTQDQSIINSLVSEKTINNFREDVLNSGITTELAKNLPQNGIDVLNISTKEMFKIVVNTNQARLNKNQNKEVAPVEIDKTGPEM